MEYERRSIDKDPERDIIIGFIISDEFIKQVNPVCKPEYFTLYYSRTVYEWCIDYYNKYQKAPFKEISSIFEHKKQYIRDQAQADTIQLFIEKLSEKFEKNTEFNVQYQIDKAITYFKERALDLLSDKIKIAKMSGDLSQAEAAVSNFKRVEKGSGNASSVWCDVEDAVKSIRSDDRDILVKFPGALGEVIRPLTSDDYIAFIGPPKRGKSFWLMELAVLGSLSRRNVLFITLEMPQRQLKTRFFQRVTGQLVTRYSEFEELKDVEIPYFDANFDITNKVFKRKEKKEQMSVKSVVRKMRSIQSLVKMDNLRIIEAPSNSMTEDILNAHLDNLEHFDDFIPDMIIVDYADIMAAKVRQDHRNSINEKWEALRTVGQQRKCLMATVSHTNRATLSRDCREDDVVEDIRKLSHLTMCIAINQLQEDKENGVQRLSVLEDRFYESNPLKQAVVTQCLDIGAVCLDSRIRFKGGNYSSDE